MRQKLSSIIALICISVYLTTIGIAVYRIMTDIWDHRQLAEREFDDLADVSSAAGVLGFTTEPFREAVRDALLKSRTLQGVIISGPGGINYTFERERGRAVSMAGDEPRFRVALGISHEPFFKPLQIAGFRNVTISAVPSTINYERLIVILKFTLIPVLAALVVALITLVLESLRGRPIPAGAGLKRKREEAPEFEADVPEFKVEVPEFEAEVPEFGADEMEAEPEEAFFDDLGTGDPDSEEPGPGEGEPEGPREPYSPRGILREDLTRERLSSELERCTALGDDMIFAMMEFRESRRFDGQIFDQFVKEAVEYFTNRDLIFERGDRGIAVIIPHMSLDQIFSKIRTFHDQVLESLGAPLEKADLCIGMSSRAERSTQADRIALEAQAALQKALEDPDTPVVAFKSDPEKYRAFMAQTQRRP
jgi:hypothetical protein